MHLHFTDGVIRLKVSGLLRSTRYFSRLKNGAGRRRLMALAFENPHFWQNRPEVGHPVSVAIDASLAGYSPAALKVASTVFVSFGATVTFCSCLPSFSWTNSSV